MRDSLRVFHPQLRPPQPPDRTRQRIDSSAMTFENLPACILRPEPVRPWKERHCRTKPGWRAYGKLGVPFGHFAGGLRASSAGGRAACAFRLPVSVRPASGWTTGPPQTATPVWVRAFRKLKSTA